jgi:hypothetical protein
MTRSTHGVFQRRDFMPRAGVNMSGKPLCSMGHTGKGSQAQIPLPRPLITLGFFPEKYLWFQA